jgi:hypothetical protein
VVLVGEGSASPTGLPLDALVLEAPTEDVDGAFATLVGVYAAALDAGQSPEGGFATARGTAWEPPVA